MPQRKELEEIGVEMDEDFENPYSQRILSQISTLMYKNECSKTITFNLQPPL